MPAVSRAQQKWAFSVKGEKWARAHHFDNKGKLPDRVIHRAIKARKEKREEKREPKRERARDTD